MNSKFVYFLKFSSDFRTINGYQCAIHHVIKCFVYFSGVCVCRFAMMGNCKVRVSSEILPKVHFERISKRIYVCCLLKLVCKPWNDTTRNNDRIDGGGGGGGLNPQFLVQ